MVYVDKYIFLISVLQIYSLQSIGFCRKHGLFRGYLILYNKCDEIMPSIK